MDYRTFLDDWFTVNIDALDQGIEKIFITVDMVDLSHAIEKVKLMRIGGVLVVHRCSYKYGLK